RDAAPRRGRCLHGRGGPPGVLRPGKGLLGGALRERTGDRSQAELLLHRLDHGPAAARARGRAARREPRSAPRPGRGAPWLADRAPEARRHRAGVRGARGRAAGGGKLTREGAGMANGSGRRRTPPKRALIGPLVMLAGGMAVGVVIWRALM